MNKKIFSLILALVVVFTSFSSIQGEAATSSKKFTSTSRNKASLMVSRAGIQTPSTEAIFDVSGLPANAVVTKIEIAPGKASMGGATIMPNSYKLRSSNSSKISTISANLFRITWTNNDFNSTRANGLYYVSFTGTGFAMPSMTGYIEIGSMSYDALTFTIYYEF